MYEINLEPKYDNHIQSATALSTLRSKSDKVTAKNHDDQT